MEDTGAFAAAIVRLEGALPNLLRQRQLQEKETERTSERKRAKQN